MLLFLDVDGTLIPFGATDPYPEYGPPSPAHPLLARLDPSLGPRLLALGCELTWATTWLEDANTLLAPRLGLPTLPVADWPDEDWPDEDWPDEDEPPADGVHWKTRPQADRSSGSTTRSPTPTATGWPPITPPRRCCTASTPPEPSRARTSRR